GKPPRRSSAIPPARPSRGLHLNAFRGEPAISGFAWHFTARRSSSGPFATGLGAALHERVPPASAWPRRDHPVSGRHGATGRPCGLAFAAAPPVPGLASPRRVTRRLILQKARRHLDCSSRLRLAGSAWFQVCFTRLAGVRFTVPSRYWCAIGRRRYLALGRGRPRFPPDSACRAVLTHWRHPTGARVAYGALTRCGGPFQQPSAARADPDERPADRSPPTVQPRAGIGGSLCRRRGLGSSPFARRYWGNPFF